MSCKGLILMLGLLASQFTWARALPFFAAKDLTPYWNEDKALPTGTKPASFAELALINQDAQLVDSKKVMAPIHLVNFFFATCGSVCPIMMNVLQDFQSRFRKQHPAVKFELLSISTMPETDTPKELRTYAEKRHLDLAHWALLTGDVAQIDRLGRVVFQAEPTPAPKRNPQEPLFDHSSNLYLVDANWKIRGIYDTNNTKQMSLLDQDMVTLAAER